MGKSRVPGSKRELAGISLGDLCGWKGAVGLAGSSGSEFTPATVGRLWRAPNRGSLTHGCFLHWEEMAEPAGLPGALPKWGLRAPNPLSPKAPSPASPGRPATLAGLSYCSFTFKSSSYCDCKGHSRPEKKVNDP